MGHVCQKHERFVPTNEACPYCEPRHVGEIAAAKEAPGSAAKVGAFVADPGPQTATELRQQQDAEFINEVYGDLMDGLLAEPLGDQPPVDRFVRCACGEVMFDPAVALPPLEGVYDGRVHTPVRCV